MAVVLNDSPAEIVQQLLIQLDLGIDPTGGMGDWMVIAAEEPTDPDNIITVWDTVGQSDGRDMVDGTLDDHYGIQIQVRSTDHPTGQQKAESIRQAMRAFTMATVSTVEGNSYIVHCAARVKPVLPLGFDAPATKRSLFSLNMLVCFGQIA